MTPADLASIASRVYGARWQSAIARDIGVNVRTVQRWAAHGIDKPATAEGVRRFLEERRIARVAPPPAGTTAADDRDEACRDAVESAVAALVTAARDVGWHEGEAWTAILAIVCDALRAAAGPPATIETLKSTIAALKAARDT